MSARFGADFSNFWGLEGVVSQAITQPRPYPLNLDLKELLRKAGVGV